MGSRLDNGSVSTYRIHWSVDYDSAHAYVKCVGSRNGESGCKEYIVTVWVVGWTAHASAYRLH